MPNSKVKKTLLIIAIIIVLVVVWVLYGDLFLSIFGLKVPEVSFESKNATEGVLGAIFTLLNPERIRSEFSKEVSELKQEVIILAGQAGKLTANLAWQKIKDTASDAINTLSLKELFAD